MRDSIVHIAICDDDAAMRHRHAAHVEALGRKHGIEFGIHAYESGEQMLFDLDDHAYLPDVVLMEADMPGLGGIGTADKLRARGYIGAIVFVTRTDRFVYDAFDVSAFNYVLKVGAGDDEPARFEAVFMAAVRRTQQRRRKYILVNGISEHRNIAIDSIRYLESRKHVCVVHYNRDDECEFISSLQRIENALMPYRFVRIHRSYLVNCDYVDRYTFRSCTLRDGTELPVGRQRYQGLREAMERGAVAEAGKA